MTKRIVIPTEDKSGLEANLAGHFGKAPYYTIIELDEQNNNLGIRTEVNKGEHVGGEGHPHKHLLALGPNIFVVQGMGPICLSDLQHVGINVLKATGTTVKQIVESYKEGKLNALTGACEHAHHHDL